MGTDVSILYLLPFPGRKTNNTIEYWLSLEFDRKKSSFGNWQTMLALERVEVLTGALLCIAIDPWSSFIRDSYCLLEISSEPLVRFYLVYYSIVF